MTASTSTVGRARVVILTLLLVVLALGTTAAQAGDTGTIKVKVLYPDAGGVYQPLTRVEVFLFAAGAPHYACTGPGGVAKFTNIPAGTGYFAATGVGVSSLDCANGEFLTPGTRLKLYWKGQGDISLEAGQTKTVQLRTEPPPEDQTQVCGGVQTTMQGTAGRDILVGTPGDDVIAAGGGNDTINGMGGNDKLCGGPGRDRLVGGGGDDLLFGEGGNDSGGNRGLIGGPGDDLAYGGRGTDSCDAEDARGCEGTP